MWAIYDVERDKMAELANAAALAQERRNKAAAEEKAACQQGDACALRMRSILVEKSLAENAVGKAKEAIEAFTRFTNDVVMQTGSEKASVDPPRAVATPQVGGEA